MDKTTKKVPKYLFTILCILLLVSFIYSRNSSHREESFIATGTANPGEINLYKISNNEVQMIKTVKTAYKFVHTVRVGNILNDGNYYILAGVSNSFFASPYGCKVVSYDLIKYKETVIDDVGDLRCKDLTIGDADNDGKNEILLGSHGEGIVRLYKWDNKKWLKQEVEKNFIAQIDKQEKANHRVPNDQLPCKDCVIQTAVHIVKIGDIDNDGKNEIVVTMSSPMELKDKDEISYIRNYKKINGHWTSETIDKLTNREFRSITIGDIYNKNKKALLIGIGSPREEKGSLYAYEFSDGKWKKTVVYDDKDEKNMKAVAIGDIYHDGKQRILITTGFPHAKVMILTWNGDVFGVENIGQISSIFNNPNGEFNAMALALDYRDKQTKFFVGGMITYPRNNIGWETTNNGFFIEYKHSGTNWVPVRIDDKNILGMDLLLE